MKTRELRAIGLANALHDVRVVSHDGNALAMSGPRCTSDQPEGIFLYGWSAEWARLAFPTIQLTHRYASALIVTKPPHSEIRAPWPFFLVNVPSGLIKVASPVGPQPIDRMCCSFFGNRWSFMALGGPVFFLQLWRDTEFLRVGKSDGQLAMISDGDTFMGDDGLELTTQDERANACLCRLLLNTCVAMSNPETVHPRGKAHARFAKRKPITINDTRLFVVGKPVTVDCRDAVRDYVEGRRGNIPTVQWLVRGHWTHQAHGPNRTLRRLQWIEPYWKGNDGAPINVRSHVLKNSAL